MTRNILVTGAAGFVGGSVVSDFVSRQQDSFKETRITAAVRSGDQAKAWSAVGVDTAQLDLNDGDAVRKVIQEKEIDIVVHTASCVIPGIVSNLITPLGERRKTTGRPVYYVHTSVVAVLAKEAGWPYGQAKDTDDIYHKEKEIHESSPGHPVRPVNNMVIELGKELGVTTFNVMLPNVYGRGSGEWRKLSVNIPASVRASMKHKTVYKFDKNAFAAQVHISDLAALYALIVEKILTNSPVPSGEEGYYIAVAHHASWWKVASLLAESMHRRKLVQEPEVKVWPSYEMAAESMGFPMALVKVMCTVTPDVVPVKAGELGWKPQWDEARFLASIDDEVQNVLDLDTHKPTLFSNFD